MYTGLQVFQSDLTEKQTWMHQSAKEGNIEDLEFYLDNLRFDKNPESRIKDGHNGLTPMHLAATNGHLEVVQLIKSKIDIANPANGKGWTILHSAALNGQLEIIKEISNNLEDKNPAAKGYASRTPLHLAAVSGHLEIIKYYYKIIPDNIGILDSRGYNSLHLAVYAKQLLAVEFLADLIALDIKTERTQETALLIAYERGHEG